MRAAARALVALANIVQRFEMDADATVTDLGNRYEAMQQRDIQTGALRVAVVQRPV